MPAVSDSVWSAQDTTPGAVEAALRALLVERHAENPSYVPARVLNLVCIVDRQWSGEIANRLRGVGRNHASRTIVCSVQEGRTTLDATATLSADIEPEAGEFALIRETVVIDCGPEHLEHVDTIVDPLVVPDLPTLIWAPHGHNEAVEVLAHVGQVVLMDSIDEPDVHEALSRAQSLARRLYVVDLAWLRSAPWRERVAATFDPPAMRPELQRISAFEVRHHPESAVAGLLLCGWLASRLGWRPASLIGGGDGTVSTKLRGPRGDVRVTLKPMPQDVRGLVGITIETASGISMSLDRGAGGLAAVRRARDGSERRWTVLGASRGEGGILGEGIRQALLRDPTFKPALEAAEALTP